MIDGGILAKIIEYSSLADSPGSISYCTGFIILNFDKLNDQQFPVLVLAAGASSRLGRPVASGPPGSGGNRFPQPYSPGCSHWPGPSIEPGRPGCVRCLVPLDPLSLPTPTIGMAENAGLAAWDFSVAVCRASKPGARCERGFRSGGGPTVIGSECP